MTIEEQCFVRTLIRFYGERGWDWGLAVEFLCHEYNARENRGQVIEDLESLSIEKPKE